MKYTIPGVSTLVTLLLWVGERWFSQSFGQALSVIPWGWIFAVLVAFLIGNAYADLFNPNSGLRTYFGSKFKIYEIEHFVLAYKLEEGKAWYEAIISVRYLKSLKAVNCSLEITQFSGLPHAENTFLILIEKPEPVDTNLLKKYSVAKFPIRVSKEVPPGYPYWGDDQNKTWAGDGDHLVKFKAKSGFLRNQSSKFLIAAIKNVDAQPEPVLLFGGPNNQKLLKL